ncbi:MAG: hypothetical protein SF029_04575 [bacterium]|nr:hypothetical protein [bacterium]
MRITLACAWQERGEFARFERFLPRLHNIYNRIVVALNPDAHADIRAGLERLNVPYVVYGDWSGRHDVMKLALRTPCDFVHYVDMDRLLRWIELCPGELVQTVARLQMSDCLIIGRTEAAYATHPRSLIETERLVNEVFTHWFRQQEAAFTEHSTVDFCAGSKGFSRRAADYLMAANANGDALHMDVAWPILLQQRSFSLDYAEVDGLDWETADRYLPQAATAQQQTSLAAEKDADPVHWALRVRVAQNIIQAGFRVMEQTRGEPG